MNKRSNNQVLRIALIIIGGVFLFSFIMCLGIGGFLVSDDSEIKTENNNTLSENKAKIAEDKVKNNKITKVESTVKKTEKPVPTETIKPTVKPTKKPDLMKLQLQILRDNFKGVANIKYKKKEKIIEIVPINKSFMIEAQMAYNGDQYYLSIWNDLIKNLQTISRNINNKNIMICVVNNLNAENYILMIADGIVIYNFVEM